MNLEELRDYCLSKKGVEETMPFGPDTLVYKVMGKVFLLTGMEYNPAQFNIKCDPEQAIDLREHFSCVIPAYHMNKKHWITVIADGSATDKLMEEWISNSYDLVVKGLPKKEREKLNAL
ncbi:MAG: MmcQ/YjbR family DNA-binding protein [Bacteroidota bacterium]